ncbi:MAG: DUF3850 domain-containing protein [Clostridia bacterium]|nr:DUF3850 domain-containing protein [Clostridia bacterium]
MMPFVHNVKCLTPFFKDVCAGIKTAEVRVDDRPYTVGDVLVLHEYDEDKLTGNSVRLCITHVFRDPRYCKEGFCVLSFVRADPGTRISFDAWMKLYDMYCDIRRELEELRKELQK